MYVAGLGKPEKATAESIRQAAGAVTRALRKHRLTRVAVVPPFLGAVNPAAGVDAVVTGMLLAAFEYREYKGSAAARRKDEDANKARPLAVTVVGDAKALREPVERARVVAEGQNFARTIASRPGNDINPPTLAKVAQELAARSASASACLTKSRWRSSAWAASSPSAPAASRRRRG